MTNSNLPNKPTPSEIVLYTTPDGTVKIDTVFQDETIWLTQAKMAELFDVNVPAISKHLTNIFEEGELQKKATISKMETVQKEAISARIAHVQLNKEVVYIMEHTTLKTYIGTNCPKVEIGIL